MRRQANEVLAVIQTESADAGEDAEIDALVQARLDARAAKDWAESDRIRDELAARDIVIQDTAEGTIWRRK